MTISNRKLRVHQSLYIYVVPKEVPLIISKLICPLQFIRKCVSRSFQVQVDEKYTQLKKELPSVIVTYS